MKNPTEAQIKEFWEGYGLYLHKGRTLRDVVYNEWRDSVGRTVCSFSKPPPIDLNNLFKYAVPFINKHYGYAVCLDQVPGSLDWYCQLVMPNCSVVKTFRLSPKDPAIALFWVLDKVRNDKYF